VRDNEVPTLTLIIGPPAMDERIGSTGITALVRRNSGDLRAPLTVQLRSLDTTEFQVPATVTIPAGKASVAFTPRVINDTLDDGKQQSSSTPPPSASAPARPSSLSWTTKDR
jgi:hypothetical protein